MDFKTGTKKLKKSLLLLFLSIALILPGENQIQTRAAEQTGGAVLHIVYFYDQKPLAGAVFEGYRIADVIAAGKQEGQAQGLPAQELLMLDGFADFRERILLDTADHMKQSAQALSAYVRKHQTAADFTVAINETGETSVNLTGRGDSSDEDPLIGEEDDASKKKGELFLICGKTFTLEKEGKVCRYSAEPFLVYAEKARTAEYGEGAASGEITVYPKAAETVEPPGGKEDPPTGQDPPTQKNPPPETAKRNSTPREEQTIVSSDLTAVSRLPQTGADWTGMIVLCTAALLFSAAVLVLNRKLGVDGNVGEGDLKSAGCPGAQKSDCAGDMRKNQCLRKLCFAAKLLLIGICILILMQLAVWKYEDYRAGRMGNEILRQLEWSSLSGGESEKIEKDDPGGNLSSSFDPGIYAGVLSVPDLELLLPVAAEWSYAQLKKSVCVYYRTEDGKMIIAGHNYRNHFGRLRDLEVGDEVSFITPEGEAKHYQVDAFEILKPEDINGMLDSEYPLTLFTCTPGGKQRLAIRLGFSGDHLNRGFS